MNALSIIILLNGTFLGSLLTFKNIYISLALSVLLLFVLIIFLNFKKLDVISPSFNYNYQNVSNNKYIITVICLVIFIILEKFIGTTAAIFISFLIFSYHNKLDPRSGYFIAMILFIMTGLAYTGKKLFIAENIANLTYYFLTLTFFWQTMIFWRQSSFSSGKTTVTPSEKTSYD